MTTISALSDSTTLATFGNLFGADTLVIFLIILIFFGAKKLPELARSMGQAMREFSKAKDDFQNEITRTPEPEHPKQIPEPTPTTAAPVETTKPEEHLLEVHPPETVPRH